MNLFLMYKKEKREMRHNWSVMVFHSCNFSLSLTWTKCDFIHFYVEIIPDNIVNFGIFLCDQA